MTGEPRPVAEGLTGALRENIETLTAHERAQAARMSLSDRIADRITAFTGSMAFVVIHLLGFGGWIAVNLGWIAALPRFDPSFVVLAMVASVEAIFLSTFVLISQNRTAAAASRRADLDLHINLLAEHELSRLAELVGRIAAKLEVHADGGELAEITRDVEPVRVLDALDAGEQG